MGQWGGRESREWQGKLHPMIWGGPCLQVVGKNSPRKVSRRSISTGECLELIAVTFPSWGKWFRFIAKSQENKDQLCTLHCYRLLVQERWLSSEEPELLCKFPAPLSGRLQPPVAPPPKNWVPSTSTGTCMYLTHVNLCRHIHIIIFL